MNRWKFLILWRSVENFCRSRNSTCSLGLKNWRYVQNYRNAVLLKSTRHLKLWKLIISPQSAVLKEKHFCQTIRQALIRKHLNPHSADKQSLQNGECTLFCTSFKRYFVVKAPDHRKALLHSCANIRRSWPIWLLRLPWKSLNNNVFLQHALHLHEITARR